MNFKYVKVFGKGFGQKPFSKKVFPNLLFLFSFLLLFPQFLTAQAIPSLEIGTSPNPVGSGARALGLGNAFIAVADDATAAAWNPGGLSQLERPEASFALDAYGRHDGLASGTHPEIGTGTGTNFEDFNYASVVLPFFFGRNTVLSLSYLKLYGFDRNLRFPYSIAIPGNTVEMNYASEQAGAFSVLTPAFGMDVTDNLSLGIALNLWNHSLTQSSAYWKTETSTGTYDFGGLTGGFQVTENNRFEVDEGYSVVLGSLYRLSREWTFGAVIKPPYVLELEHARSQRTIFTGALAGTPPPTSSDLDGELEFPLILGLGAAWRPTDPLTVSTDVTWTQWSEYTYRENRADTNPITGGAAANDQLEDTITCRTGLEYLLIFEQCVVPLRCGAGYDPAPAMGGLDEYYTLNCGAGLQFGMVMFDLAYEYRWGNGVNSDALRAINGTANIRQHRLMASLIVYF